MYKTPTVLNVEYLFFWCGATRFLGGTYQSGAKHITKDLVHDVVLWCTFMCHNVAGSVGSNFSELHAKWLHAHPTQLRVTRHRVGCDDTQKRWVWPRDLYFWGLGWVKVGSHCMFPCPFGLRFFTLRLNSITLLETLYKLTNTYIYLTHFFEASWDVLHPLFHPLKQSTVTTIL